MNSNSFLQGNITTTKLATEKTLREVRDELTTGTLTADLTSLGGNAIDLGTGNASTGTQRVVLASDQPPISLDLDSMERDNIINWTANELPAEGDIWSSTLSIGSLSTTLGYTNGASNTFTNNFELDINACKTVCETLIAYPLSTANGAFHRFSLVGVSPESLVLTLKKNDNTSLEYEIHSNGATEINVNVLQSAWNKDTCSWLTIANYNTYRIVFNPSGTIDLYIWKPDDAFWVLAHRHNITNNSDDNVITWQNDTVSFALQNAVRIGYFNIYQCRKSKDYNTGNATKNTQRVVLANDQPAVATDINIGETRTILSHHFNAQPVVDDKWANVSGTFTSNRGYTGTIASQQFDVNLQDTEQIIMDVIGGFEANDTNIVMRLFTDSGASVVFRFRRNTDAYVGYEDTSGLTTNFDVAQSSWNEDTASFISNIFHPQSYRISFDMRGLIKYYIFNTATEKFVLVHKHSTLGITSDNYHRPWNLNKVRFEINNNATVHNFRIYVPKGDKSFGSGNIDYGTQRVVVANDQYAYNIVPNRGDNAELVNQTFKSGAKPSDWSENWGGTPTYTSDYTQIDTN
jgi:hypothetical protein